MKNIFLTVIISVLAMSQAMAQPAHGQDRYAIESAEVRMYNGRPSIFLNGEPQLPQLYALTDWPSGRHSYESTPSHNIAQFAKAGFRLFQLDIWFEDMISRDGKLDITEALMQVDGVLKHRPDAAVMFRLHVNAPTWWLEAHPEEWARFADAEVSPTPYRPSYRNYMWQDLEAVPHCSYASEKWQDMMEGYVAEFCRMLAPTRQGYHVMAIQIAGGLYGEHHNWAFTKHDPDVSAPMHSYFKNYLRSKYGSDRELQKAWNDPMASIESVEMPMMERHETSKGIFRDPQKEMRITDYYEAVNKCISGSILRYASIVKRNWPRPVMAGTFYGYYFSMFGRQAAGGHLCEEDIFSAPDIDFICAPQAYNKNTRRPGGPGLSRGLIESATAHGKLWLDEMDQPSHFGYVIHGGLEVFPKPKSVHILRRFVMEPFLRGGGMWYYDFGPHMTAGWWDDPDYLDEIAAINRLENDYLRKEFKSAADVLMVYDTKVFLHTASQEKDDPITDQATVNISGVNAFKSGAAVATCYLSDIRNMPLEQYKAVVFMNCYVIDADLRRWISRNVASGGRSVFWLTAPGYNDGRTISAANVSETCGIKVEECAGPGFFRCADSKAVMLDGVSPEEGTVAVKRGRGFTSFFLSLPPLEGASWQRLFRMAGCHIYSESTDALIAGSGMILINTAEGGEREITLRNGFKLKTRLSPAETLVLDAESGEILLPRMELE